MEAGHSCSGGGNTPASSGEVGAELPVDVIGVRIRERGAIAVVTGLEEAFKGIFDPHASLRLIADFPNLGTVLVVC